MPDETDIAAQHPIRAALDAMVSAILGDTGIVVLGRADHQRPDEGGLVAIIAAMSP